MSKKQDEINAARRDFFKKAGIGAGAAAVAVTASSAGAVEATSAQPKTSGYAETDHVRKFYELARF